VWRAVLFGIETLALPSIENDTELAKTQYLKRELLFASSMVGGRCKFKPVLNAMQCAWFHT